MPALRLLGGLAIFALLLPASLDAACSCTGMTIRTAEDNAANSSYYCVPTASGAPTFVGCTSGGVGGQGCAGTDTAYRCALGRIEPGDAASKPLGWTFEAQATVTGTPSECTTGQLVTATVVSDGVLEGNINAAAAPAAGQRQFDQGPTVHIVASPSKVPNLGAVLGADPLFGADNYSAPQTFLRIIGQRINWLDDPTVAGVEADETLIANREFISYVLGNGDQSTDCWCRFTIEETSDQGVQGGNGVTLVASRRCALDP